VFRCCRNDTENIIPALIFMDAVTYGMDIDLRKAEEEKGH